MTTILFRFFVAIWDNHFGLANFFLSIYPSSYSILILWFFPKKYFDSESLAGQEKKIYSDLTFSQYNHILAIFTV